MKSSKPKHKKKSLILKSSAILLSLILAGCGSSSMYDELSEDYLHYTQIEGLVFDYPTFIDEEGTSILEIVSSTDYSQGTYVIENEQTFLAFNIESFLLTSQSNTEFSLEDAEDIEGAIEGSDINGAWFTLEGDVNEQEEDGVYKCIAQVEANVSITPDVYNTFSGQFVYVSQNGSQYALFFGTSELSWDEVSSNDKDIIEHVVASFSAVQTQETESGDVPQAIIEKID